MNSKKILLIDDMKGIRDSLTMILSLSGYEVDTAENGQEGLERCKQNGYDLVITDILMPKLDGSEIIMELDKSKRFPILAISAGGHGISAEQALTLASTKADAVLEKPFSKEELLAKVSQLIGN